MILTGWELSIFSTTFNSYATGGLFVNTKLCEKPITWLELRVLSKSFPINTNMIGLSSREAQQKIVYFGVEACNLVKL